MFPWLGTRAFRTVRRLLQRYSSELGISDIQSEGCSYITFKSKMKKADEIERAIIHIIERDGIDTSELVMESECPIYDKYDEYIPPELLRDAYALDRLCADEVIYRFTGRRDI